MHRLGQRRRDSGFTVIDLMVVGVVVVVLLVLALVVLSTLGSKARMARRMANSGQLRGIHQGFVTWAQSNKAGGRDGYYPGLDASGNVIPDGPLTGHSGDGTVPAAAMWMLLNGNFVTPEDLINPRDKHAVELALDPATGTYPPVTHENFSYALQSLAGHPAVKAEWKETLNTSTLIMGDRAIGTGPADISSVWTEPGSGDWRGAVVHGDNSTGFTTDHVFTNTKYGGEPVNPIDDIFEEDSAAADAFLVHEDATTAYSAK